MKTQWLWLSLAIFVPLFLDQATKQWALIHISDLEFYKFFGWQLHKNPGAIFGILSDAHPLIRISLLASSGAFLVFVYGFLQYLISHKNHLLRLGLSLFLGGILGNMTDRVRWGHVVDFMVVGYGDILSPAFNVADVVQWSGYALIGWAILSRPHLIFSDFNRRKTKWINPKFQLKYIFTLLGIGLSFSLLSGVFSYTYIQLIASQNIVDPQSHLNSFLLGYGFISFIFLSSLFFVGMILSHKIAGPLYALKNFLSRNPMSNIDELKFRKNDDFLDLQNMISQDKKTG